MTWRDRPYAQEGDGGFGGPGLGLPRPTRVVAILLIANFAVFLLTALARSGGDPLIQWGALMLPPAEPIWQVWRWVTYQYLHGGAMHIFFNMIGLYFLGPPLERLWGGQRFFAFYTFCGVVAGLGFALIQVVAGGSSAYLIGASGCILGCIAACAILFPHMMLILLFFPVPIRAAAVILAVLYTLMVLSERNLSEAAHLAGMAGGVIWVWGQRRWPNMRLGLSMGGARSTGEGAWQRKMSQMQEDEEKVDRILDKIRKQGMGSLTWWEKRFLKQASERRRQFDEQQSRRY